MTNKSENVEQEIEEEKTTAKKTKAKKAKLFRHKVVCFVVSMIVSLFLVLSLFFSS